VPERRWLAMLVAGTEVDEKAGLMWLVINLITVGLGYMIGPRLMPKTEKTNIHDDADLIGSMPIFFLMTYLAFAATFSTGSELQQRWEDTSWNHEAFLWLYVMRQIVSFPFIFTGGMSNADKVLMTLHHIVSIMAFGGALVTKRMHWYATLDGCCEITTIFLNFLLYFRAIGYKGFFNSINGVTLWFTFMVFRIILFPYWLYRFGTDIAYYPAETSAKVTTWELVFYPFTNVLLLAMSTTWFISITKGMLKAVGMIPESPKKSPKKD